MRLDYTDHRTDPAAWAHTLGISREATELYLASEPIDLHIDSFIWHRIWGYDLRTRHDEGLLGGRFYSQVDFPRVLEAGLAGATWVITTNPARSAPGRRRAFARNLSNLRQLFATVDEQFALVRNVAEYRAARAAGKHAAFVGIQGGNALDDGPDALDEIPDGFVLRITLVHLTSSSLGATSSPLKRGDSGLTDRGRDYVRRLNEKRIFVDLAHVSPKGFWDAVEVHDKTQPLIVTHTGVCGVHDHWRNLDDDQIRAIAKSGGTIGVMYELNFLGPKRSDVRAATIVDHLEHIIDVAGEDHASLGSDWDGAITTPPDLRTCLELPRLVQIMLDRGWSEERVRKVLSGNFLRTVAALRG